MSPHLPSARRATPSHTGRLNRARAGYTSLAMLRRAVHVLIAAVIALAAVMPIGAHAMPMPSAANGMAADQPCPSCPQHRQSGDTNPGKMPACQILACAGPLAMLPAPILAHEQAFLRVAYLMAPPAHWAEARPAPDPFPPRPIVLV